MGFTLDPDAIDALYRVESRAMLGFFARRTYDAQLAVDLVGETFARALDDRDRFRGGSRGEAAGWVWGIARNVLADALRRGGAELRTMRRLGVEPVALTDDERLRVEELAGLEELRALVREALAGLRADQREAVWLRVVDELPYADVARRLGVSEQTARARVSRGLRALGSALDGAEGLA